MTYTRLLRRLDPSLRRQRRRDQDQDQDQDRGSLRRRLRQGGWHVRRAAIRDADGVLTVSKEVAPGERARLRLQTAG